MIFQKPFPQIERKKSRKNLGKNFFDLKSVFGNNFKFLSEYLPLVIARKHLLINKPEIVIGQVLGGLVYLSTIYIKLEFGRTRVFRRATRVSNIPKLATLPRQCSHTFQKEAKHFRELIFLGLVCCTFHTI